MKKRTSVRAIVLAMLVLLGTVAYSLENGAKLSESKVVYQAEVDWPWVGRPMSIKNKF